MTTNSCSKWLHLLLEKENLFLTLNMILAISACLDFYLHKGKKMSTTFLKIKNPNNILNKKQYLSQITPKKLLVINQNSNPLHKY